MAPAAGSRRDHHSERLKFHIEEAKKAETRLKRRGLKVKKGVPQTSQTSGQPASVSLDNELLKEVNDHQDKIATHKLKMDEYDGWYQMMSTLANAGCDAVFVLDHDDWLYFFGK